MQLNPAKMARPVHADGRRYVPAIDGLRVLAAWGVISAHVGSEFGPTHTLVAYYGAAAYPALIVFFTISGFLVYRPFARAVLAPRVKTAADRSTNFWIYLLRRVLRIFPLYWAVLAVAVIWNGPGTLHSLTDWVQAIFLLPLPHPMKLLTGPLGIAMWTLAIELPFYVVVPLFAAGIKKGRARFAPDLGVFESQVITIGSLIVIIFSLGLIFGGALAFPVMSLPVGMLFAVLETRQALIRRRYKLIRILADNWWVCLVGYVCLVFIAARLALDAYDVPGVTDPYAHIRSIYFPLQITMALLLFIPVAFGMRRSLMVRFMAAAPLQMLAPLTYGIYLWHVPLIRHTADWFGPGFLGFPIPGTTGFGLPTLFLAIVLAITTFVVVELPAAKLRERVDQWSRGREQRAGAGAGSDDDVEFGEAGYAADLMVEEAEEAREGRARPEPTEAELDAAVPFDDEPQPEHDSIEGELAELRADADAMHANLHRAGTTDVPGAAAQWCEPIDGFRAICACLIVAGHTFLATSIIPFAGVIHVIGASVALFFAISAFVLYQPFIEADVRRQPRPGARKFWTRRMLRIFPLFAFALTVYLIVLPEVRPDNLWGYVRLYGFLQIFGHELSAFKGIPAAWYLCNEVIFYLFIPFIALGAARWSNNRRLRKPADRLRAHIAIGWGLVFFGPLLRTLLYAADVPAPSSLPFSHLEFFGFGIVVAGYAVGSRMGIEPPSLIRWLRDHSSITYALVLVPVLLLAGIGQHWGDGSGLWKDGNMEDRLRFFPYLMLVVLLMTAAALAPSRAKANAWLSQQRFKVLSALALHIFLWQQLVLGVLNKIVGGNDKVDLGPRFLTCLVMVAVALGATIAVAWVTQPLTDWPYEQYRKRNGILRRRGTPPPSRSDRGPGPRTVTAG
ncbi:acyltransferase family protein [Aquihabitans sp. McL0605]|uniref:acyltransferase family protein n=1 Tax=Aquihabitans sp. McL0605 TaxID=3415671 RepID=UPI003CEEFD0A